MSRTWRSMVPEAADGWKQLLADAGLKDVIAQTHKRKGGREFSQLKRYSAGDMWRVIARSVRLYFRPGFRQYVKESTSWPKGLFGYLGYGLYVGRK